jgi:hypothetical protein
MSFKRVLVCDRCNQSRARAFRVENGKRRGYCPKCAEFLRGQISEAEAPPERPSITSLRTGWTREYRRPEKPDI